MRTWAPFYLLTRGSRQIISRGENWTLLSFEMNFLLFPPPSGKLRDWQNLKTKVQLVSCRMKHSCVTWKQFFFLNMIINLFTIPISVTFLLNQTKADRDLNSKISYEMEMSGKLFNKFVIDIMFCLILLACFSLVF